jgi:hypothetical protein
MIFRFDSCCVFCFSGSRWRAKLAGLHSSELMMIIITYFEYYYEFICYLLYVEILIINDFGETCLLKFSSFSFTISKSLILICTLVWLSMIDKVVYLNLRLDCVYLIQILIHYGFFIKYVLTITIATLSPLLRVKV